MSGVLKWTQETLPWLQCRPADFRNQCSSIDKMDAGKGPALQALANHYLDLNDLNRLARLCAQVAKDGSDALKPLTHFRLGLVSNATTNLLVPCLVATALRHGIELEVVAPEFGQCIQQAIDPNSLINKSNLDAILMAIDHQGLSLRHRSGLKVDEGDSIAQIEGMRAGFKKNNGATLILQTIAPPPEPLFGNFDCQVGGSIRRQIGRLNDSLIEHADADMDLILDVAALASAVGIERWHDIRLMHHAKLAFSPDFIPLYADHVARLIAAMLGKSRKCLVLDLDNTIWGGVIGDDGVAGICLGEGDALGEAFLDIQRMALNLRERGIVLAVCSKNNDETARLPFRQHLDMILQEEHIAVFQANWNDKASNIEAIAKTLNIGLDTLVFVDDSPVERAQVRGALPTVTVPELPKDPALFPRIILTAGYFETVSLTAEDLQRADQYAAQAERASDMLNFRDLDEFLASLNMKASVKPFDEVGRSRISQLFNKTNQFNLMNVRYNEDQVAEIEEAPDSLTFQLRLTDKFGDNGVVSAAICKILDQECIVENWVMSCRVFNRRVEELMCDEIVCRAQRCRAKAVIGHYAPTERNALVADLFSRLGFSFLEDCDGFSVWRLEIEGYTPRHPPIKLEELA